jgi:hypothetical protein
MTTHVPIAATANTIAKARRIELVPVGGPPARIGRRLRGRVPGGNRDADREHREQNEEDGFVPAILFEERVDAGTGVENAGLSYPAHDQWPKHEKQRAQGRDLIDSRSRNRRVPGCTPCHRRVLREPDGITHAC